MATNTSIGNLSAILTADASNLVAELNRAATAMQKTEQTVSTAAAGITGQINQAGAAMEATGNSIVASSNKAASGIERMGSRLILYAGFRALAGEIKNVITNINNIPDIPPEVVGSVISFRDNIAEARGELDKWIAEGVAGFAEFGQAIGVAAAMMGNGFSSKGLDFSGLSKLDTPDQIAAAQNAKYWDQVRQAEEKLAEAQDKLKRSGESLATQYDELTAKAAAYNKSAATTTNTRTTLDRINEQIKALNLEAEAKQKLKTIDDQYTAAQDKLSQAYEKDYELSGNLFQIRDAMFKQRMALSEQLIALGPIQDTDAQKKLQAINLIKEETDAVHGEWSAESKIVKLLREHSTALDAVSTATEISGEKTKGLNQQLADLKQKIAEIDQERAGLNTMSDSSDLLKDTQLLKQKAQLLKEVGNVTAKLKQPALEMTNAFVNGFEQIGTHLTDFIVKGKFDLNSLMQTIETDVIGTFLKLAIINPMINALFAGGGLFAVSGFTALPAFAGGGDPPVGTPSLVGEQGPELFIPKTSGTIIPNNALSASSQRSGGTYYIDARGADAGQLSMLQAQIKALNGSIEQRSVTSTLAAIRRGGAMGNALRGYA